MFSFFRRNRQPRTSWAEVLDSFAAAWGRPVEKSVLQFRRSLTVPPDDLIHVDSSESWVPAAAMPRSRGLLLLTARWPGRWNDQVMVQARKRPRVIYTFGKKPIAIDDPARSWIVRSEDPALACELINPEMAQMIDAVWDPECWMTVWERKGEVQVFVGERDTSASTERLERLIAIARGLVTGAQTLSSQ